MSVTPQECRVTILVKALPQPSKRYGETVCCAGVTPNGQWKRLYPIRFRHLSGNSSFKRWDQVSFRYSLPRQDKREESCHVHEESIKIVGSLPEKERARVFDPLILPSVAEATRQGRSLALIRPIQPRFSGKRKSPAEMTEEREAYLHHLPWTVGDGGKVNLFPPTAFLQRNHLARSSLTMTVLQLENSDA